jgi:putative transposase
VQALKLSVAVQSVKLPFWQARYYDFNIFTGRKMAEKLRYMHRNPVARGLVEKPEDWRWSSYNHYLSGSASIVEIESEWTTMRRDRAPVSPRLKHETRGTRTGAGSDMDHPPSSSLACLSSSAVRLRIGMTGVVYT